MKFNKLIISIIWFFLTLIISNSNLYSDDFKDLEESRVKVYGSEKDEKYRLDGFFVEWENWPRKNPTHNYFHFFWFANTTNYPKFKKDQVFPFFSNIESKVDSRKSTNYLLLYNSSVDRNGSESVVFFPFYYSGNSKLNNSSYLGIFPLFYTSNINLNTYSSSTLVLPGFYKEKIKDSNTKTSSDFTMSAFYYSNSSTEQGKTNSISWFPILPLFLTSETEKSIHNNYLWIVDTNKDRSTQKLDRFWLLPLFYWKKDNYLTIFPIYFNRLSKSNDTDDWFGLLPPIYRSYSPAHSTFYFINFYKSTKNLKTTQDSFLSFFPFYFHADNINKESFTMVPILYMNQKEANSSSHTNLLLLYDQAYNAEGNLDRLWLIPFYFYKKNSYNYIVPFFFQNTKESDKKEEKEIASNAWFGILPPIYRSYSANHSTFYLINFFTTTKKDATKEESLSSLFPFYFHSENSLNESFTLFPVLYYNRKEKSGDSHTNLLLLYDQILDKENNFDQLWVMPFYFYKKNSYRYIIPLYFGNDSDSKKDDSITWGPFYYIRESERNQEKLFFLYYESHERSKFLDKNTSNILPLFYSWNTKTSNIVQGSTDSNNGFFLLPLFYRNTNKAEETYSNLLGVISWTKDKEDKLIQNTIFPIRFYQKDSYSIWFPFSFQFGKTESESKRGKRWGAFFYSSWTPEEEKLYIFNYYSKQDIKNDLYSKTFFPLFHTWKQENSKGSLFFPIYVDADFRDEKETDKFNNFSLNILGIASQTSKGIFQPSFSLDGGKKSKYYYLDTDVSWLYYAFRISNRTSTKLISDLLPGEKSILSSVDLKSIQENDKSPRVNSKKSFSREDSFNFLGINLLFGVFGYEAADTKRHIRLLPLAWFTYDTEVDENIYAGPLPLPFVWYTSANLKYRVIFPIYGYQNSEDAERHSYGLFLFLKEALLENHTQETSVIWPFINWHKSDLKSGSRALPFYWQRTSYEKNIISDSTIIPIGLTYINRTTNQKNLSKDIWITPFVFRTDQFVEDGKTERIFSPLALFYWSSTKTSLIDDNLFVSPVYLKYDSNVKGSEEPKVNHFWMVPIFGFESRTNDDHWLNYFLLFNKSENNKEHSLLVFPFYSQTDEYVNNELVNQSNFYFPLVPIITNFRPISKKNPKETYSIISPLLFSTSIHTKEGLVYKEQLYPIPFFYKSYDKKTESNFMSLLLLFQYETDAMKTSYRFFPLVQFSNSPEDLKVASNTKNWFFPIYWKSNNKYLDKDKKFQEENKFISLAYSSISSKEDQIQIIPLLLYYASQDSKESYQSLFFLANHTNNEELETYNFFPFYHYSLSKPIQQNTTASTDVKNPISKSNLPSNEKFKNEPKLSYVNRFFPFYSYKTSTTYSGKPVTSEFTSIFYSFENEFSQEGNPYISKYWIPIALYSNEKTPKQSEWSWLFFIHSESNESDSSFRLFPIFHSSNEKNPNYNRSKNWFFPFYYFNKTTYSKDNSTDGLTVLPFLFYYASSDYEENYQNWLLLFNHKEKENSISYNFFPIYHYYSTKQGTKYTQEYENWFFPFYSYENKKSPEGLDISTNFLSIFYASTKDYSDNGKLTYSKFWIPIVLYSNETTPTSSQWSWLFLVNSKTSFKDKSFDLYPIFHSSNVEDLTSKEIQVSESKNWLFPIYYYSSSQSTSQNSIDNSENSKSKILSKNNNTIKDDSLPKFQGKDTTSFVSLLFNYSSELISKEKKDYETTFYFPIIPIIYREASSTSSHTNLFYFFDRKLEKNTLKRFFLFPYYYSNEYPLDESSTSYYHFFPIYFSGVDKKEYTAFITGLYINSNESTSYKNFLFLLEQESLKKSEGYELNFLLRILHYKSSLSITNFQLLYGIGEIDLQPKQSKMNLVWLSYENTKDTNYLNLLPVYYKSESKYNTTNWITPLLYYSNETNKKKLEHSTLGLVYYNSEDLETKESLQNILLGIIYYKTVKPKERGYTGRGSLWGALWEYNTEEETNYSKFSILKILYSRREDNDGVRHRILFLEF